MTQRTLDSQTALTTLLIACAAFACNDQRLRELGYTSDPITLNPDDSEYEEPRCEQAFIDADSVLSAVAADVAAAPAESRPFLRYLSLANLADAGACPEELASNRFGVVRLLNSVSRGPSAVAPRVSGPSDSVIAIDLRDYGFTSALEIGGTSYADAWEAFVGESPFSVELAGETAAAIAEATGTPVPVLSADAFILSAVDGAFYYTLLGVPNTLGELRASVGLPSQLDPAANGAVRTAEQFSRILRPDGNLRVLDRYTIANGTAGTYWEASPMDTSLFLSDPLHAQPDVQRLITYSLPNDLFAFAIFDAAGQRREFGELVLDTNRDDFTAHVTDSCSNCHAQGLIPAVDIAIDVVSEHPDQFDPEVVAAYRDGPSQQEKAEQFTTDSEPQRQALTSLGVPTDGANAFVMRFLSISQDVTLDTAAADLLVTPDVLRARLAELPSGMRILGLDLNLSRERFAELYRGAYCVLHAEDENPPSAAACAAPLVP